MSRSARLAIITWLACVLACVFVITRAEFNADLSAFLPRSPTPAQQVLVEQLRDGVVSRLILIGIEGATPQAFRSSRVEPFQLCLPSRARREVTSWFERCPTRTTLNFLQNWVI